MLVTDSPSRQRNLPKAGARASLRVRNGRLKSQVQVVQPSSTRLIATHNRGDDRPPRRRGSLSLRPSKSSKKAHGCVLLANCMALGKSTIEDVPKRGSGRYFRGRRDEEG